MTNKLKDITPEELEELYEDPYARADELAAIMAEAPDEEDRIKAAKLLLSTLPPAPATIETPTGGRTKEFKPSLSNRGDGGSTSYYFIPPHATELKDIIKYKKMEHGIGEAFCALYRLNDNGEYLRNLNKALYYIQAEINHYKESSNVLDT